MTSRSALWALAIIFIANFLNYTDRQLVSALENPLETALDLDDIEFGLLWTLFTIGYMICALPLGFLADRGNRPRIFALCILIWSLATIASGCCDSLLVYPRVQHLLGLCLGSKPLQDFGPKHILFGARVLIGVGEAGCLVIGPSLISDLFTPNHRGRALSVFYLGLPLGGTSAFLLAGLAGQLLHMDWRTMFLLAGSPGLVVALALWFVPDPPRGVQEGACHGMHGGTLRDSLQLLRTPTLVLIILAQAFAVICLIPLIHFGTRFLEQSRGMNGDEARLWMGGMALLAGALGTGLSGWLGDRFALKRKGAYALLAGLGFLLGWPCLYVGFTAPERRIFLPALTLGCFCYFLCMPAVNTQIANVVSPAQRATAWAWAVFLLHLFGDTGSPPLFGALSKQLGREQAFALFSLALLPASGCCLLAVRTAARDQERITQVIQKEARG